MPTTLPPAPPPASNSHQEEACSPEQEARRLETLAFFADPAYTLSGAVDTSAQLTELEKFWLTSECALRYLRATKWAVPAAIQRLEDTLRWRRDFGVDALPAAHVEPEAVTGKLIVFGYDTTGRPALYMIPSRQNTHDQTRQIQFTVWMLERCIDLMPPGVETLAFMINFADRAKNPSLGTARKVLNILQSHYPERLGLSLIINVPFLVMAFLNIILPFVDPVTRDKVKFNPMVVEQNIFAADQVMREWHGSVEFQYQHDAYWAELVRLCEARRVLWLQRWRALGGRVGISESDFKQDTPLPNGDAAGALENTQDNI